jgi:hypothetical protein
MKLHYKIEHKYIKRADITNCPLEDYNRLTKKLLEGIKITHYNFYEKVIEKLSDNNEDILNNDYMYTKEDYEAVKQTIIHVGKLKCNNNNTAMGNKRVNKLQFYKSQKFCKICKTQNHTTTNCWYNNRNINNNNKYSNKKRFNPYPNNIFNKPYQKKTFHKNYENNRYDNQNRFNKNYGDTKNNWRYKPTYKEQNQIKTEEQFINQKHERKGNNNEKSRSYPPRKGGTQKPRRIITKPIETFERIPMGKIQKDNITNIKNFIIKIQSSPERTKQITMLLDTGATFTSICPSALETINYLNTFTIYRGRPFNVSTGNGIITYPGTYINIYIQQPEIKTRYKTIKAYLTPHELKHKFILGVNDQKQLGYIIAIKSGTKIYFNNKGITKVYQEIKELQEDTNVGYDVENNEFKQIYLQDDRNQKISEYCTEFLYMDEQPKMDLTDRTIKEQMIQFLPEDQKQQIVKQDIEQFNFHPNTSTKIQNEIRQIIKDVYQKHNYYIANRLKTILLKYTEQIGNEKFDIGKIPNIKFSVKLKPNIKPIKHKPISLNPLMQEECDKTINLLLKNKIIEPIEHTDWATPVFIVMNHDKSSRMVTNYKKLNEASIDDLYPTPNTQEMLQKFNGKTIFTKFDIIKAFFNIEVEKATKPLLSIVTKRGIYTWNRMPFGHKNCPAVWARASDYVFEGTKDLIKYIDDLVLASSTCNKNTDINEHFIAIEEFFQRLRQYNLKIKLSKCKFFVEEITFLGNKINAQGIKPDEEYIYTKDITIQTTIKFKRITCIYRLFRMDI